MIARSVGPATALVTAGLAAAFLLLFSDLDRALVIDAYLVLAGAVLLLALTRATGAATRPRSGVARRRRDPAARARPDRLLRLEGQVALATATAADFHFGVRPQLRAAAAHRLRTRLGIELDAEPERAAAALGPEAWPLLRPDRQPPEERLGPGVPAARLERVVERIEGIGA